MYNKKGVLLRYVLCKIGIRFVECEKKTIFAYRYRYVKKKKYLIFSMLLREFRVENLSFNNFKIFLLISRKFHE